MVANIFSKTSIDVPFDFNVVSSFDDAIEGLPTLIIGYDYVNEHYPDFDITNIHLGGNLYWTFKKNEKRDKLEKDLRWFITKVYTDLINDLSYIFIDPIQYNRKTLVKIIRKIYSLEYKVSYFNEEMVYIYGGKFIFGVNLKLLKYMGLDVEKIKFKIKNISDVFLDDKEILIEYKSTISSLDNKVRYIPFLYLIRNGKNNTSSVFHLSRES